MDIKIVDSKGEAVVSQDKPIETPSTVEGSYPDEMYQNAIGQVLGLENSSDMSKYSPQLKTLLDYLLVHHQMLYERERCSPVYNCIA